MALNSIGHSISRAEYEPYFKEYCNRYDFNYSDFRYHKEDKTNTQGFSGTVYIVNNFKDSTKIYIGKHFVTLYSKERKLFSPRYHEIR
jgi:hypothetical protein